MCRYPGSRNEHLATTKIFSSIYSYSKLLFDIISSRLRETPRSDGLLLNEEDAIPTASHDDFMIRGKKLTATMEVNTISTTVVANQIEANGILNRNASPLQLLLGHLSIMLHSSEFVILTGGSIGRLLDVKSNPNLPFSTT